MKRYKDRVVWTDKELNLKLMRKGLLTRIYAPMVSCGKINLVLLVFCNTEELTQLLEPFCLNCVLRGELALN